MLSRMSRAPSSVRSYRSTRSSNRRAESSSPRASSSGWASASSTTGVRRAIAAACPRPIAASPDARSRPRDRSRRASLASRPARARPRSARTHSSARRAPTRAALRETSARRGRPFVPSPRQLGELVEHCRRALVGCHDPVVAHYALDLARLRVGVVPGSRGRDVDVLTPVPERDAVARVEEPFDALVVQPERPPRPRRPRPARIAQVDPQQHRAVHASGPVSQAVELLGALTLEEDRAHHEATLAGELGASPGRNMVGLGSSII